MKIKIGKVYSKQSSQNSKMPKAGILPRYVNNIIGSTVWYNCLHRRSDKWEFVGESFCTRRSFEKWAEIELPFSEFEADIEKEKKEEDESFYEANRLLRKIALLNASVEDLLEELKKRLTKAN